MSDNTERGIIAGVSGSAASVRALRWAAQVAERRRLPLRVILAWEPERLAGYAQVDGHPGHGTQEQAAHERLGAALRLAFWPALPKDLITEVVAGSAERILVDRSANAELLVLGSAAVCRETGSPIGPVIRGCLSQARCPVAVIGAGPVPGTADCAEPNRLTRVLAA